jgi:zinc transport system substrate-binding protein
MKKLASILLLCTLLSACQPTGSTNEDRLSVVATFYPYGYFAQQVGGDLIDLTVIVPTGIEPHDYEPSPVELKAVYDADLFIYNGVAFEPWVEDLESDLSKEGITLFEASSRVELLPWEGGEEEEDQEYDPHFWLDPVRAGMIVNALAAQLGQLDPENASIYTSNAEVLSGELSLLNANFSAQLASCSTKEFVTSHAAFSYLANRYSLTMIPINGLSPDDEPSLKELGELSSLVKERGLTTVFTETLLNSSLAETISKETGAKLEVLNPLEGLTTEEVAAGENYLSILQKNLENLAAALGCSALE